MHTTLTQTLNTHTWEHKWSDTHRETLRTASSPWSRKMCHTDGGMEFLPSPLNSPSHSYYGPEPWGSTLTCTLLVPHLTGWSLPPQGTWNQQATCSIIPNPTRDHTQLGAPWAWPPAPLHSNPLNPVFHSKAACFVGSHVSGCHLISGGLTTLIPSRS